MDYPLPQDKLIERYKPYFDSFTRGQSSTLVGLPYTAKSGFLRFVLEYDQSFLNEFIDTNINHIITLSGRELDTSNQSFVTTIASKFLSLKNKLKFDSKGLAEAIQINNKDLCLIEIEKLIKNMPQQQRIILIIFDIEEVLNKDESNEKTLMNIWRIKRQTNNNFCYGFTCLPSFILSETIDTLSMPLTENVMNFDLLTLKELEYIRKFLSIHLNFRIDDSTHEEICGLSGGHHMLYKCLYLYIKEHGDLDTITYSNLNPLFKLIFDNLVQEIENLTKDNHLTKEIEKINLLKIISKPKLYKHNSLELELNTELSPQQEILLGFLLDNKNIVLTREKIAEALWGKNWQEKYSDWVIDKTISKIRKAISVDSIEIITIRNSGYKVIIK